MSLRTISLRQSMSFPIDLADEESYGAGQSAGINGGKRREEGADSLPDNNIFPRKIFRLPHSNLTVHPHAIQRYRNPNNDIIRTQFRRKVASNLNRIFYF